MPAAPPALPLDIRLELPHFSGTLPEVAQALRSGLLTPAEVPLMDLVSRVLERFHALRAVEPEAACEALPLMAGVVAWKLRKLLPPPEPQPLLASLEEVPDSEDGWEDDLVGGLERLSELERLVQFLSAKRQGQELILAGKPLELNLPRRERDDRSRRKGLSRLLEAARSAVREVRLEQLSRERLTLEVAYRALRAFAGRLRRFVFSSVTVAGWGERTVYFTALLEGVRENRWAAQQAVAYAEIEVWALEEEDQIFTPAVEG